MIFNGKWFLSTPSVPENIEFQLMGAAVKETWRRPGTQSFMRPGLPTEVYASLPTAPWLCLLLASDSAEAFFLGLVLQPPIS